MAETHWVDLDGPVHYRDHGGPDGAPLVVCVHGLGGSHANWSALAPLLTDRFRVLAPDLAGFGLTTGGSRSSSVPANRLLLDRFLSEVADGPAIVVGNSMGGLISALQAAERPQSVSRLVLIDPALPIPVARPDPKVALIFAEMLLPRRLRRAVAERRGPTSPEDQAVELLELVCADPGRVSETLLQEHRELAAAKADDELAMHDLLVAARSLRPFLGWGRHRLNAALHSIEAPVLLIHGDRDRLVNIRAARNAAAANPAWDFRVATGVGHVPMMEVPDWTAAQIRSWLAVEPAPVG